MIYSSLNKNAPKVSFKEAMTRGLAPDKGLYFPESIEKLDPHFIENLKNFSNQEIGFRVIEQFIGSDIPRSELEKIILETLCFDFPLIALDDQIQVLELFHGPTMAFKDVGARFMARCLGYFNESKSAEITVLVATSGDTGGAVASGFLGVKNVNVVILYPSKKVSEVQEKQLTTLGQNIKALEVNGNFDDCQAMVKHAFLDQELLKKMQLTSANSINIARWLPQMFYFFFAYKQLAIKNKQVVFSVPSGNYGNICAGLMAKRIGLPIDTFIAATNANDVVPNFLNTGAYQTKPAVQTISNAMDVGDPSNFVRIMQLYNNQLAKLKQDLSSFAFSDTQTKEAMVYLKQQYNYVSDPHGAVAYLGLKKYLDLNQNKIGIFLETAHPVKFLDVVEPTLGIKVDIPAQIAAVMHKKKQATPIENYDQLKAILLK